jgi:acetylornithine deacetylase/succinyl-diaminopimelate desuccinylase-like protein
MCATCEAAQPTGVLGPHSNAHGPNEFLHIDYAKKLTACVADVLTAHAAS